MHYYLEAAGLSPEPVVESPAEKVLKLADQLPATRNQLIDEAERVERLLREMPEAESETGNELAGFLVEALGAHLDSILGLLEYDETGDEGLLEESLALIVEAARVFDEVEAAATQAREEVPLVA